MMKFFMSNTLMSVDEREPVIMKIPKRKSFSLCFFDLDAYMDETVERIF